MEEILFWGCAVALAYTFVGYPLLIAAWARLGPRPVRAAPIRPRVAIIVVAHNEEGRMGAKLRTCLDQDYPADLVRIVVASDGSTDRMNAVVEEAGEPRVLLLPFADRRGKAACLNDAVAACDEDVLVFTDARQTLGPDAVRLLVETLGDLSIGAVSGELVFMRDDMTGFGEAVDAYWRYEKFIRQSEARVHSVPGVTGALYAIRRSCFRPIPHGTILDDVAIPMQAVRLGYRTVFESRAVVYDRPSRTAAQERLRKVRTLAGNYQLVATMPWLLVPGVNPIFVQFASHKLMRLAAPFAMAMLLAVNALLAVEALAYAAALALQLVGYGLALTALVSTRVARWRPARLASTFLVMNWYAVLGLAHFVAGRSGRLWSSAPGAARG